MPSQKSRAPTLDPKHCRFRLRLGESKIHRWGVYAEEAIPANRKVIEYTGELISRRETNKRAGKKLNYIFEIDSYWAKDGGVGGSGAEYINHCCEPNLRTVILRRHILYYSKRPIRRGEELTVDYNFDHEVEKVKCFCGAAKCRGTINHLD